MLYGDPSLKTLYLLELLMEKTDEEHPLSAAAIVRVLEEEYQIHVNRTTIYSEIRKLTDAGTDIEHRDEKPAGYYVGSRMFELAELKLLVDAVQASKFITQKKSAQLIRKLETLCSQQEAKQLSSQVTTYNRPKTPNETVFYNVDRIHSAIFQNHQITYQYVEWTMEKTTVPRHGGAHYNVSPLHLIWDDENYYLIAFDEQTNTVRHYRVDKMRDLVIQEDLRSSQALEQKIDVATFSRKTFGMYSGVDRDVQLQGTKNLAGVVLDRFGTNIWMRPLDKETFSATVTVTVSRQFFGWLTAIGPELRITGPEEVKEAYRQYLEDILDGMKQQGEKPRSGRRK
jgi:predicted DNA-binding transcriptional regulator YafY